MVGPFQADPGDRIELTFDVENIGTAPGTQDLVLTAEDGSKITVNTLQDLELQVDQLNSATLTWDIANDQADDIYQLCVESEDDSDCVLVGIGGVPGLSFTSYYRIDEGSGTVINDLISSRDMDLQDVTWTTGSGGIGDTYLEIEADQPLVNISGLGTDILTIGTWVKFPDDTGSRSMIEFNTSNNYVYNFQGNLPNDGDVRLGARPSGNFTSTAGFQVGGGNWAYICCTLDRTTEDITFYAGLATDNDLTEVGTISYDDPDFGNATGIRFQQAVLNGQLDGLCLDGAGDIEKYEQFFDDTKDVHL